MFFNKKITSLAIAVLASSSVVFAQNYVKTTTNSSESSNEITVGSKVLYNNTLSLETANWGQGPALKMEPSATTLTLYGSSLFNINKYKNGEFPSLFNIQNNGNVGIGTSNPDANLHIKPTTTEQASLILEGGIVSTTGQKLGGSIKIKGYSSDFEMKLQTTNSDNAFTMGFGDQSLGVLTISRRVNGYVEAKRFKADYIDIANDSGLTP